MKSTIMLQMGYFSTVYPIYSLISYLTLNLYIIIRYIYKQNRVKPCNIADYNSERSKEKKESY